MNIREEQEKVLKEVAKKLEDFLNGVVEDKVILSNGNVGLNIVSAKCHWKENSDGYYETDCDNSFVLTDGTLKENDMRFCCYCGKIIEEVSYIEDEFDKDRDDMEDESEIDAKTEIQDEALNKEKDNG